MKMKRGIVISGFFFIIAVLLAACASNDVQTIYYHSIIITEPDLDSLADGNYVGEYRIKPAKGKMVANPYVKVSVTIKNQLYEDIEVIDPTALRSDNYLESMRIAILENQNLLSLDAVSGATLHPGYTGKAYLKAIEQALIP
ncbi:MAG: hypothetical protein KKI09_07015 [Spirochaetes bacterium]|nr:hypothetical protein [Spirochaetota bacterium]MBU0955160.1 hypothetical protein [Spirochaetota bacterium]